MIGVAKSSAIPKLRVRFFRVHLFVAIAAVLIVFAGFYAVDYTYIRGLAIDDYTHSADSIATLYTQSEHRSRTFEREVEAFNTLPGLSLLCIYERDGAIVARWEQADMICPSLLVHTGIATRHAVLRLAHPIEIDGQYAGMVYMQGTLLPLALLQQRAGWLLLSALIIAAAACWFSGYFSARCITRPLLAIRRQIECFKEHDINFCPLPPHTPTRETAELAASIADLRRHLDNTMVPKETIIHLRGWHWEVLSGLLTGLRYRIPADSPLLEDLSDYALLLQTERGDILPTPTPFRLLDTLASSLTSARRTYPPDARVNLTASAHPALPPQWMGHGEVMEALMRHLLLIGLKRTRKGFVCLRLESQQHALFAHNQLLHIRYEDSGPPIQQGQLHQRLSPGKDTAPPADLMHDISWLLVARLVKRLGGSITGNSGPVRGIMLELSLPMAVHAAPAAPIAPGNAAFTSPHLHPPLILVVERDKEIRKTIARFFAQMQCDVFMVDTHAQAVEIAPILPFSAIMLNALLAHVGEDVTRRLRHLMEDGMMPTIPLWVMLAKSSFIEFDYWRRCGASELLLQPLQPDILRRLCANLATLDTSFYEQHDLDLRRDLPLAAHDAMPHMNRLLAEQIAQAQLSLEGCSEGAIDNETVHQIHAVKSAALTLGYFRLAGLMGQIEHARASQIFATYPDNWRIVMDVLKSSNFATVAA